MRYQLSYHIWWFTHEVTTRCCVSAWYRRSGEPLSSHFQRSSVGRAGEAEWFRSARTTGSATLLPLSNPARRHEAQRTQRD
jgi:hypothetical protein